MNKKTESGQMMLLAAIMMVFLVGIAAFCLNGAYAFNQHSRMQDDLDNAVKFAATGGDAKSFLTSKNYLDISVTNGITISNPPTSGPYSGTVGYVQGTLTQNPKSLFGKLLRFPFQISVQAVAVHGTSKGGTFAILGLSPTGNNQGDSINFQDSANSDKITGNVDSNSNTRMQNGASVTINGTVEPICLPTPCIQNAGTSDHYASSVPSSSSNLGIVSTANTNVTICGQSVKKGEMYIQPLDATGVIQINTLPNMKSTDILHFLPYCSGGVNYPGVYLFNTDFSINNGSVTTYDSVIILEPTRVFDFEAKGPLTLSSPDSGPYEHYSVFESDSCTPTLAMKLKGTQNLSIKGLIDMSCGDFEISGNSSSDFEGPVVGYLLTLA